MSSPSRASPSGPSQGETEDRFRLLVESVKDYAIFILDTGGRVATWNLGAERIKGYKADEIIGKHFSIFYPPEDIAAGKTQKELEIATSEGRFEEEGWRIRKDGSRMWANVTITALRNPDGTLVGFAKVTRDLTERRQAEEETHRFRLLVDSVKDYAIFILDGGGHVATWNLGAERIKGYKANEIIGKHFSIFYPPEDVAAGKTERELEIATREGRFEEEGWRIRKDGSRMWANVTITALRNPDGTLFGFAKVTRDLTERRQAEETRRSLAIERAALEERARLQEFQERFVGILGHDLRSPLAAIDYGAALLQRRSIDPAMRRTVDRMRTSSVRMSRMIEQILDLTRARLGGGFVLKRTRLNIAEMLTRVIDELRSTHPSAIIDIHCSALEGEWDEDRLEQVFSNIIGNAIMYGQPMKPIRVETRMEGSLVSVVVQNRGNPIPDDLQAVLFDPFRRGQGDGGSPKTEGLGLGLYISNEVVKAHGGRIEVRSNLEDGTTFRVILPLTGDREASERTSD